ncbi:MAG: helix-turn-helix domain-containing protein [Kiritimatiellae bacterium]|nr:helix-turn-helix domain-containing protein [Kiritimatiellia bacterium]HOU21999.1 helix-turn-helix domain-containing protein [Kiritimatiellia bacterium]HQN01657.1 helix-turn-helix domain-containing protein [Candidatus Hydrogenedentota bacterium]HQQ60336.1 helix-turn-helix domain-containing protein [Kiritimatiellia bacterium]
MPLSIHQKNDLRRLGGNIRRERTARAITQERLAELADLNLRTVQKIEAGNINILITTVLRIQRALACPWPKLLP